MNQTGIIKVLWLAMLASPGSLYLMLLLMDHLKVTRPTSMESADYLMYAGFALVPAAVFMLRLFKDANRRFLETLRRDPVPDRRMQQRFLQRMIIGMAVADAPASIAFVYYFLSGDIDHAALLVLASLIICYFFRPQLPAQHF